MFRVASLDERDRLFEIWHDAVKATHHFLDDAAFNEIAELVRDKYLPNKDFLVFVDSDDRPLGFMGTNASEVESLFIDPNHFGKGIGKAFIDHMKSHHGEVRLEVNEQNPQAVGFYEACGFEVVRRDPTDDHGRPFPILHMLWSRASI